jgi:hypothetical protein
MLATQALLKRNSVLTVNRRTFAIDIHEIRKLKASV